MNPWIDVFGWTLVVVCIIFLRYEIPRAICEIRKILSNAYDVEQHIGRGNEQAVILKDELNCPTCEMPTGNRFWYRCPCCGSNHQPM